MLNREENNWLFHLSESKKKKCVQCWQEEIWIPSHISALLGWTLTAALQETVTAKVGSLSITGLKASADWGDVNLFRSSLSESWLNNIHHNLKEFLDYVTVCGSCRNSDCVCWFFLFKIMLLLQQSKVITLDLGKMSWQCFLVKFSLWMIRNNLIIQEFKMDNFALENEIG